MKNFHTHTSRCHHATGNVLDYTKSAIEKKMTHLGFSDHTPLPDNRWLDVRMHLSGLADYSREIDQVQNDFNEIKIYKGAECEFAPQYINFYKEELLGKYQFQFLVGGGSLFSL